MSLQYVDYSSFAYPPQVIFAKGPGNQKTTTDQGAGRPKAAKKEPKKPVKKAVKKAVKKGGKKK